MQDVLFAWKESSYGCRSLDDLWKTIKEKYGDVLANVDLNAICIFSESFDYAIEKPEQSKQIDERDYLPECKNRKRVEGL